MTLENKPLNLILRRRAAYLTLSDVLTDDDLLRAMWMIETKEQLADRLTFISIVGVTAESFAIDSQIVTQLYSTLNNNLELSNNELPPDPLFEMLKFRGIKQPQEQNTKSINAHDSQPPQITATSSSIFRTCDILGETGKDLTENTILLIGQALGSEAKELNCHTIIMARDARDSSKDIAHSLAKGIISVGADVIDLGCSPISLLNFVTHHYEGKSGVMISGGDRSSKFSGLKMVVAGKVLEGEKIQQIKHRIEKAQFAKGEKGALQENHSFMDEYIGMINDDINLNKPMTVVLDTSKGIAGILAIQLMQTIGCEVIDINSEKNKQAAEPGSDVYQAKDLDHLISSVKKNQADLGFAFDVEGARLRAVDSEGEIVRPDRQMMLFAKNILVAYPCCEIIHDNQSSSQLVEYITKHNGRPLMWKSGAAFMSSKVKTTGAKLAGDMHGHIYFNDRWFGFDDALYAACRLLEILSMETGSSHEVFAELPESSHKTNVVIKMEQGENQIIVDALIKDANFPGGEITEIDGLRVDFSQGWSLIRPENDSSSLLIQFEATNQETLIYIQEQMKSILFKLKPDIQLPF